MTARVTLRPACEDDAPFLERWDSDQDVISSHGVEAQADEIWRDEGWREEIAAAHSWQRILVAEEDGRPVGVIVCIDPLPSRRITGATARPTCARSIPGSAKGAIAAGGWAPR